MKNEKCILLKFYVSLLLLLSSSLVFADINVPELFKESDTENKTIELRQKFEDWNKDIDSVGGASISYTDDRIENTSTWQTQGSVIYPIQKFSMNDRGYTVLTLLPSVEWSYLANIEELTFQLPVFYTVGHSTLGHSDFYISPFYLTDFDFDGAMIGAELKYEPTVLIGNRFQTGKWHSLTKEPGAEYLFRVIPGLNYSRVLSESLFINREEKDDIFAITTSLELKFKPFGRTARWEISGTYDLLYDFIEDSDGYSDQWSVSSIWWMHKNIGLDLEYKKGDTALTNIEIDIVTLSFRLRL